MTPYDEATGSRSRFDVVFEVTGHQEPLDLAARLCRVRGRLVIVGYHQDGPRTVDLQLWNWRGLDVINAHERDPARLRAGPARGGRGRGRRDACDPRPCYTHSFGLEELGAAYRVSTPTAPTGSSRRCWVVLSARRRRRPRLGFLGVGWIGRTGCRRWPAAGAAAVAAVADADQAAAQAAAADVGCRRCCSRSTHCWSFRPRRDRHRHPDRAACRPGGRALEAGGAVFCQKPLGRTAAECSGLMELARRADLLPRRRHVLPPPGAVPRRWPSAWRRARSAGCRRLELTFHNAYGPDKAWVHDAELAGGGALIDLGCHLLDLALGCLGELRAEARCRPTSCADGRPLAHEPGAVEDLALAQLRLPDGRGRPARLLVVAAAGCDAVFEVTLLGDGAGPADAPTSTARSTTSRRRCSTAPNRAACRSPR